MHWMDVVERMLVPMGVVLFVVIIPLKIREAIKATRVTICSRCSYDLSGQTADSGSTCPECGCDLTRWGVLRIDEKSSAKIRGDHHKMVRGMVWCVVLVLAYFWVKVLIEYPPIPFEHRETSEYTLAQTPPGLGTVVLRKESTWITDNPLPFKPKWTMTELRVCEAQSSIPGAVTLDLNSGALTFEDVVSWVVAIDPSASGRNAERVAMTLFGHAPGYDAFIEERGDRFMWYWSPAPPQPYGSFAITVNGQPRNASGGPSWSPGGIGRPAFDRIMPSNVHGAVMLVVLTVTIILVATYGTRPFVAWTRLLHRRWIAALQEAE